jgi:hypothetical protein
VIGKAAFVHARIKEQSGRSAAPHSGLRAIIAGLRKPIASPN